MTALGVMKIACSLALLNALIRICDGTSASGFCPPRTCGETNGGVQVRYPFVLQTDAIGERCYTDYPYLQFVCMEQFLFLNFTANLSNSYDMYEVVNIDYLNQTLSIVPQVSAATCRSFDATRFADLNITNTSTLLLDCPLGIPGAGACEEVPASSNVCNSSGSGVVDQGANRLVCSMNLTTFGATKFTSCHLMDATPTGLNIRGSIDLELQFTGNITQSLQNYTLPPVSSPAPSPNGVMSSKGHNRKKLYIILGFLVGSCSAIVLFLLCIVCWCRRHRARLSSKMTTKCFIQLNLQKLKEHKNKSTTFYTLKELEEATKNFSDDLKLGSGGFGIVYKGTLDNGIQVAIKKANGVDMKGSEQYMNEVCLLSQVNHRNLVRLHGCCLEVEVPMLVYKYVPNGDLFQHLQGERLGIQLTWTKRLQIAIDTAEALRYLHLAADPPIYHRDVKSSNILLDDNFNVKIADFGISRLVKSEATHVSTLVQGTPGYLDPEYFESFHLTEKSDVYSFGMVLLELVTSLKPIDFKRGANNVNLKSMALPIIEMGNVEAIADARLFNDLNAGESYKMMMEMQRVVELAANCLADHRHERPSMKEVVVELVAIKGMDSSVKVDEMSHIDYKEEEMVLVLDE